MLSTTHLAYGNGSLKAEHTPGEIEGALLVSRSVSKTVRSS
jgi:hypothetical protein